jgi:hypothetical protein
VWFLFLFIFFDFLTFEQRYVDLREWTVCKLPMLRAMPLTDFWADADLQVVYMLVGRLCLKN